LKVGVLVPFTNINLEQDLGNLNIEETSFHYTRIGGYELKDIPGASEMENMGKNDISAALRLLAGIRPDAVLYGCTSASLSNAFDQIKILEKNISGNLGCPVISASGAIVNAIKTTKKLKLGFVSPYTEELTERAISFFNQAGFQIVKKVNMENPPDSKGQGELSSKEVFKLAIKANHNDVDIIVISCTDLNIMRIINSIEKATGKIVITSNQAMIFSLIKKFNLKSLKTLPGRLFEF